MPPKKKDEEIDLSTLPPWLSVVINLKMDISDERQKYIEERLQNLIKESLRIISRDDIVNYAVEKGLYINPEMMTDKQKKDKGTADIPTELTSDILANAFEKLLFDLNIQGRKVFFVK